MEDKGRLGSPWVLKPPKQSSGRPWVPQRYFLSTCPIETINVDAPVSFVTEHGCITPAVSGAHLWVEWLHQPCLLGVPIVGGVQYGYITPTFSGSP